jgi:MscS family membrane protein
MMRRVSKALALAALAASLAVPGLSAEDFEEGLGAPATPVRRDTPRETVVGYLSAARDGDFATAAHYLDLRLFEPGQRAAAGAKLARRFKIVLDNTFWVDPQQISDRESGVLDDGLGTAQELLTVLDADGREIPIRLHVVARAGGGHAWLFDRATVAAIDDLYDVHGYGWLGDKLPTFFFTIRIFEVELWQLVAFALLIAIAWGVAGILTPPLMAALNRGVRKTAAPWDDELAKAVRKPLRVGLIAFVVFFGSRWLGLAEPVQHSLAVFWRLLAILVLGWLLSSWVSVGARLLVRTVDEDGGSLARSFVPLFARVIRIGVWIMVVIVALDASGVEVMGLVAGLGIGGLAIAFAAQKTIENFFGALAIAADRPFQRGDFVDIGGTKGTVEAVGLRSTRLRTTARTLVSIPNGSVMTAKVENVSVRDRILFNPTIGLVYGSTRAQIELVVDEIKKLLANHPKVFEDSFRVRMTGFGPSSIDIGILSWIDTTDYNEYTAVVEELNLEIMGIVERVGTGFAFPSQTLYLARDSGMSEQVAQRAETEVEARRAAGELWIPEPPDNS